MDNWLSYGNLDKCDDKFPSSFSANSEKDKNILGQSVWWFVLKQIVEAHIVSTFGNYIMEEGRRHSLYQFRNKKNKNKNTQNKAENFIRMNIKLLWEMGVIFHSFPSGHHWLDF